MQYAICAAAEALQDAQWNPSTEEQRQYTGVSVGSGRSSKQASHTGGVKSLNSHQHHDR